MNGSAVAKLVESSQYCAIADDSLKDEDNAAWVLGLESDVQREWIERIGWIRKVDRLAEAELVCKENHTSTEQPSFLAFYRSWKRLLSHGPAAMVTEDASLLATMQQRWFHAEASLGDRLSVQSWDRYLDAILTYHTDNLRIETLADYETMLETLAGSFFQILPFLSPSQWEAAYHFGAVDQFYNNLRDIDEDARQGICYFPQEVLDRFGVDRAAVLDRSCIGTPAYHDMMVFWVDDYLPQLRRRAFKLVLARDLHPSWVILRNWCLHRYARIERVLRECDFDFVQFQVLYWQAVREDLDQWQERSFITTATAISPTLQRSAQAVQVAAFLKTSPLMVRTAQRLVQCLCEMQGTLLNLAWGNYWPSSVEEVVARL